MPEDKSKSRAIEHYADIDDDNESALGADIFRSVVGMSVEEILDETEDSNQGEPDPNATE